MNHAVMIAGLGRCGTSLAMQMLHTAGVLCVGHWPDFENTDTKRLNEAVWATDWRLLRGRAFKHLTAHQSPIARPPDTRVDIVWLSRDLDQQSRSILKMMGRPPARAARRKIMADLERDTTVALARLGKISSVVYMIEYEELIQCPREGARQLAAYAGIPFDDAVIKAMSDCVLKSDPRCAPDLAMEVRLLLGSAA